MSCALHVGCGWTPERGCPRVASVHRAIVSEPRIVGGVLYAREDRVARGRTAHSSRDAQRAYWRRKKAKQREAGRAL